MVAKAAQYLTSARSSADRAPGFEPGCRGFKSLRAYQANVLDLFGSLRLLNEACLAFHCY